MTYTFFQPVVINNSTASEVALKVNQSGNNEGIQVVQNSGKMGLRVTKVNSNADTATSIFNMGGGYGLYVQQDGNTAATVIKHNGLGTSLYVNKASTGTGAPIVITNAGTGNDIVGNSGWYVSKTGDATFNNVNTGCGKVYASNTAIAGGRIHIYDRGQGAVVDTHCSWGIGPVSWTYAPYLQGIYVVQMILTPTVHCPVIKVTPWLAGQYDETQNGLFNYYEEGNSNVPVMPPTAIEPHIVQIVPDRSGCAEQVDLYFQCCVTGNPAVQYPYEVYYEQGASHDLVFDFEVLGCVCEIPN